MLLGLSYYFGVLKGRKLHCIADGREIGRSFSWVRTVSRQHRGLLAKCIE